MKSLNVKVLCLFVLLYVLVDASPFNNTNEKNTTEMILEACTYVLGNTSPYKVTATEMEQMLYDTEAKCSKYHTNLEQTNYNLCFFENMGFLNEDGTINEDPIRAFFVYGGYKRLTVERVIKNCIIVADNKQTTAVNLEACLKKQIKAPNDTYTVTTEPHDITEIERRRAEADAKCKSTVNPTLCFVKTLGMQNPNGTLNEEFIQAYLLYRDLSRSRMQKVMEKCIVNTNDEETTAMNLNECMEKHTKGHYYKITENEVERKFDEARKTCVSTIAEQEITPADLLCYFEVMGVQNKDQTLDTYIISKIIHYTGRLLSINVHCINKCIMKYDEDNLERTARNLHACMYNKAGKKTIEPHTLQT